MDAASSRTSANALSFIDLGIVFDITNGNNIITPKVVPDLFPKAWVEKIQDTVTLVDLPETAAGKKQVMDELYDGLTLVGARFDVCQALGRRASNSIKEHCWPQVRLVWQPSPLDVDSNLPRPFDAGIHEVFFVPPELALSANEAQKVSNELYKR